MPFPIAAAALIGGGLAAGGLGSFLGASRSNRSARSAQIAQTLEASGARRRQGIAMFGPQDWADFEQASGNERDWRGKKWVQIGERWVEKDPAAAERFFGKYGSTQEQTRRLNELFGQELDANVAQMRRGTQELDALAAGAEGAVDEFGNEGEARIRRDTTREREAADQRAAAGLSMLGANSLLPNQQSQNARRFADTTQDAITNLRDRRLGRFLGARGQRLQTLFGRRGAEDVARDAATRSRFTAAREPIDAAQAMFSGQAFQPYTPLQGPNQSPLGTALASAGSGLSTLGSLALFSGSNTPSTPSYGTPSAGNPYANIGMFSQGFGPWR